MSDNSQTTRVVRWSLFALSFPLSAFISLMGWVGTGFGGLTYSIPLLLVLPVQAIAFYSFRIAAAGLWMLLAIHLLLPFRFGFHSLNWSDLAPSRIDSFYWAVVILMGVAALLPSRDSSERSGLESL
jgi:hypothetical protein